MKLNEIKYLPKSNAVAKVIGDATGMPFVGEMMVAAAGQDSEPTPDPDPEPAPFEITDMTVMVGEGGYGTIATTTNASTHYINVTIMDATGQLVWFTSESESDTELFYSEDNGDIDPNATVPSFGDDVGNYTAVISDGNGGEWTVTGRYSYFDE